MSFYVTTPIFYVNAQPHLGHAYTAIVADTISRFKKLAGEEVRFQTGTDEHGDKIAAAAEAAAETPGQYVDRISGMFRAAWPPLNIKYDNFIRTTEDHHVKTVQAILQKVYDQGDIYFSEYSGLYCRGCERFLTEKELIDGNCPDHQQPPAAITEQNYFFRMSKYQDWLIDHIKGNPDFIRPERYRNEVLAFLQEPLEDLCISRPTSRLTWGIPLPFDDKFVTYVWFDALINYLSGINYPDGPDFAEKWAGAEHIIAKDILKPHAIFWPTMLRSMGLAPYRRLHVHGFWTVEGVKMSKSIGNVIQPADMVERFGTDATRYFLLREMSFGLDADFSYDSLLARQNSDLANDLGNLVSRSLTMVKNFRDCRIPQPAEPADADRELAGAATEMLDTYRSLMNDLSFHKALQSVWKVIGMANRYIVSNAPWELAKDPAGSARLDTVLYTLLETLRLISLPLQPIIPETAARMAAILGIKEEPDLAAQGHWGGLLPGSKVTPGPALFPRLERGKKKNTPRKPASARKKTAQDPALLDFKDFQKIDLRVAEIVAAEKIKKSDRLLKLTVKAPEERVIVAGIAEHYEPEGLIGRQVIIAANLKPAKLMGVKSHGMVLAVKDGDRLVLSAPGDRVEPGSRVS